ncbi:hypothetical protein JCM31447_09670 [Fluviispira sanaruensis]|uniref:Uncharacterized protein n=1 Tax=Fluviispira sanaruensis TaxID=2493639 RepID=A0A4P2VHU6_FLUSA|nr:hypothetical protein JCM31447_09670 [Fluviispira sanaruensis]
MNTPDRIDKKIAKNVILNVIIVAKIKVFRLVINATNTSSGVGRKYFGI